MSEPLSGSGTAAALGGATVFGLFTGTDFGIVFGAFAGALFVATIPQALSAWRVAAHFLVSFIVGVLGARLLSAWVASKTGYDGTSADALCAVLVSLVSVKIMSFIHQQDIRTLGAGAMLWRLMQYSPRSHDDAVLVMRKARTVTETVLLLLADRTDDDSYDALNAQYTQFVTHWQTNYLSQQDVMKVTSRSPQPSLALANRLYQDASRADELVQAVSPVHPAFMPLSFTARNT